MIRCIAARVGGAHDGTNHMRIRLPEPALIDVRFAPGGAFPRCVRSGPFGITWLILAEFAS
jgi:hypothetical protein